MIGGMIENLKNPKNVLSTVLCGYVATLIGYFWTVRFGRWEWVGQIIGFLGVITILWTLLRLGLTKILVGIILVAALVAYFWWYQGSLSATEETLSFNYEHAPWEKETSKRLRPKYSDSGLSQNLNEFVFAPAYMFDSTLLRRGKWDTSVAVSRSGWTAPNK